MIHKYSFPPKAIALCCPASRPHNPADTEAVIQFVKKTFSCTVYSEKDTTTYLPPAERAEILMRYFQDPDIELIWALRGGEGSADLIPFFEQHRTLLKTLPKKTILGFSDITALLLYFYQEYEWPVIHGPCALDLCKDQLSEVCKNTLLDLLMGTKSAFAIPLEPMNAAALKNTTLQTLLTGGNLSLLNISIKDVWEIKTEQRLLFVEDANEKPHVVLRTLKYLQHISKLNPIQGLLLGDFIGNAANPNPDAQTWHRYLQRFAEPCPFPVFCCKGFGHGFENYPLPLYKPVTLKDHWLQLKF